MAFNKPSCQGQRRTRVQRTFVKEGSSFDTVAIIAKSVIKTVNLIMKFQLKSSNSIQFF